MNDESVLNEYSQLVNDLVNTKRELSRINAALIEKEHFSVTDIGNLSQYLVHYQSQNEKNRIYKSFHARSAGIY